MQPPIILCSHVSISPFIYIMYIDGRKMKYSTLYYVFILTCKIWCFYWSFRNPLCVAPFKIKKGFNFLQDRNCFAYNAGQPSDTRHKKKITKKCLTSCDKRRMHTQAPANSGQGSYFMGPVWYLDVCVGERMDHVVHCCQMMEDHVEGMLMFSASSTTM